MRYCRNMLFITAGLLLVALISSCSHRGTYKESPPETLPADAAPTVQPEPDLTATPEPEEETPLDAVNQRYADITAEEISKEIATLLSAIRKSRTDRVDNSAHLQLAWLYGHHKNPSPQYLKALQELDEYLSLSPEYGHDDFLQNWHRTLKEVVRLSRENKDLREKAEQMKRTVEQLKHLDIEIEKRRQDIK